MDRENTPLKQRQKRGGNATRRSSASSSSSSAAAPNAKSASTPSPATAASSSSAAAAAATSVAPTGGASARAFRANNTRTRTKTPSSSAAAAAGAAAATGAAPAMILAKHPPTILRAAATPALYNPDAPPVMRSSPPPQSRYSDGSAGYLHVNTRQQHAELYSRHSTGGGGGGDGPVRTLYQPPPSSSPSLKKVGQQHHTAGGGGGAAATAAAPPTPTLLRPHVVPMSSEAHPSNLVAPPTSVKLITPQYQFATDLSSKLAGCLELTSFTVVGVLGFDGVGKSTLLSLLHGADDRGTRKPPTPSPRSKKASGSRGASTATTSSESVFSPQSFEKLVAGDFETSGVDLAVSHDPSGASGASLVLLDTQPMLSSAMLCELLNKNESPRFGALTPEQQVEVHSFQLATFLLSICHYVVIAHDALADLQVVRFLQQAETKLQSCRVPHISGGVKEKHVAKLLFVTTRLSDAALLCKEQQVLARHVRALESAWPGAFYRTSRAVSSIAPQSHERENASSNKQPQPQIPVLVLPPKPTSSPSRARGDYDDAVLRWRRFVQRLPNAPSFSRNPAAPHAMNLREWLSNASRVFESVRKSGVFTSDFHSGGRDHH